MGKLMGLAMRSNASLSLDLPSMVWKPLVSAPVSEDDVLGVDILSFKILELLKELESAPNTSPEMFEAVFDSHFETIGSDGKVTALVPGGRGMRVRWANRRKFMAALIRFRLNEYKVQCAAIRRGLACVVPYSILTLFTPREIEIEVCGRTTIDVDLWEKNTRYSGCAVNGMYRMLMQHRPFSPSAPLRSVRLNVRRH
jgi:hypothetical protein